MRCPRCHRDAEETDAACSLCGEVLRRAPASGRAHAAPVVEAVASPPRPGGRWTVLGVGVLLAPVLTLTPLLQYVGWFLGSLCHETGHVAVAWAMGCPAFPAIRLDGHVAAIHREQQPLLCAAVLGALLLFAWRARHHPRRLGLAIALLVAYPFAAFTGVRDALFLLGGHLGELAFASILVLRGLDGGLSGSFAERCAHAGVAAYLVLRNARLAVGLLTTEAAREAYAESGSFGLVNDLLRFSREVLATPSLAPSAALVAAACLVPVALAVAGAARGDPA